MLLESRQTSLLITFIKKMIDKAACGLPLSSKPKGDR